MTQARIDLPVPAYRLQAPELWLPDPEQIWFPPDDSHFFMVDMFDETLTAFGDDESEYITPRELWWYGTVASFSVGSQANTPFAFQLMHVISEPNQPDAVTIHSEFPINAPNIFGTGQKPFILPKPKHFSGGTRLVCRVTNLQNASNAIQVVFLCYIRDLPE